MSSHNHLGLLMRCKQSAATDQSEALRAVRRALVRVETSEDAIWADRFNRVVAAGGFETAAIMLVERQLPGVWWFTAKGKTEPTEPLYGAQLMFGREVIGQGENEESLALAICAALLSSKVEPVPAEAQA